MVLAFGARGHWFRILPGPYISAVHLCICFNAFALRKTKAILDHDPVGCLPKWVFMDPKGGVVLLDLTVSKTSPGFSVSAVQGS